MSPLELGAKPLVTCVIKTALSTNRAYQLNTRILKKNFILIDHDKITVRV